MNHISSEKAPETREEKPEVALQIPSDSEFVRVVRLAVMGVASRMAFSYNDIEDIKLAVSEACNNAILHAQFPSQKLPSHKPPIVVRLASHADRLEISVEDGGHIPTPGLAVRPVRKAVVFEDGDDLPEGGMGLFLIQSLMDEVRHERGENDNTVICMTKFLQPKTLQPPQAERVALAPQFDSGSLASNPKAIGAKS